MPQPPLSRKQAAQAVRFVSEALADGFKLNGSPSAGREGCRRFRKATKSKLSDTSFRERVERAAELYGIVPKASKRKSSAGKTDHDPQETATKLRTFLRTGPKTLAELQLRARLPRRAILEGIAILKERGVNVERMGDRFDVPQSRAPSYTEGKPFEIISRKDNTYSFGCFGDLHAASKHTRWDVREDLVRRSEKHGVQAILDAGNWIDGECRFNRYDLEVAGLEQQCALLARKHPRTKLPIYTVSGDDHEGWYEQREGINIGRYNEQVMRGAGHNWTDLGFMEAHITLRNVNSGKTSTLALVHPGGGSAYALSYSIQKIVESYEGGQKPDIGIYGHYHKLMAAIIRNIWTLQSGTQQDQTPFMRKKRLEAHVGGIIADFEQDPRTGAIIGMTPQILRYFDTGYYSRATRWSHSGPVEQPRRTIAAIRTR